MAHRLARNTVVGISGTAAIKLVAFASTQVLARGLGQEAFGIYAFVGVYLFFAGFLVDLGMEIVLRRELAARPATAALMLGNAILLKWMLAALVIPVVIASAWGMTTDPQVRSCIILAALGLPLSTEGLFRAVLLSRYAIATSFIVSVVSALSLLVGNYLCMTMHWPIQSVFLVALLNGAATVSAVWILARRYVKPRFELRFDILRMFFRESVGMGAFALLFMMVMRVDQMLLFQLRDAAELGRYVIAVRITEALFVVPEALLLTWFPMLAASLHTAPAQFLELCRLGAKGLAAIIFAVGLALTFASGAGLTLLFGAGYADSVMPTIVLGWGMYFAYMGAIFINAFVIQSLQRLLLLAAVLTGSLNILLNIVLIRWYGATGSALAMLLANFAGFALWFVFPATRPVVSVCLRESLRPAASAVAAGLLVAGLGAHGIGAALFAVVAYVAVLAGLGGIDRGDVGRVRHLVAQVNVAATH